MKKALKVLGIILGLMLLFIIGMALYINIKGIPHYEIEPIQYSSTSSPEILERGHKIVSALCANCHRNEKTGTLAGRHMTDAPAEWGFAYAQNITQDTEYGIGEWTDAEIKYLIRTGVGRDGRYYPPYMAKLPLMADEDINAIIAFLRSDHPMVRPDPTPDQPCEPSFLAKALSNFVLSPLPLPDKTIPMPDTNNSVELGKYYAINFECFGCHSPDFKTMNPLDPESTPGYFSGGNPMLDLDGNIINTANLTPHKESGIGSWSKAKFIKAVKFGIKEGDPALRIPMMPYAMLTDKEVGAIYDYLVTIPPIDNTVERNY
jgi:mono/diheme cytochrome c family protein/cytochrome c551/c552